MTSPYLPGDRVVHAASRKRGTVIRTVLAAVNPDYYTVVLRFDEDAPDEHSPTGDRTISYGEWAVRRLDIIEEIGDLAEGRTNT